VVALWSIRTGLLELSSQLDDSYRNIKTVVDVQANLLNRLVSIKKPQNDYDWTSLNQLNDRLKYNHDAASFQAVFFDLQNSITDLSDTFYVETQNSAFYKLVGLLNDSQKHVSLHIQTYTALSNLYTTQLNRFPHRYYDSFLELPRYPDLRLPDTFEHISVISTYKERSDDN
jgi:hypothetical protein